MGLKLSIATISGSFLIALPEAVKGHMLTGIIIVIIGYFLSVKIYYKK